MLISFFNKHRFTLAMLAAGISIALVAGTAAAYGYVPELMLLILGSIICILIVRWPVVGVALILVLTPLEGIVAINQSLSAAKVAGLVSMVVFIGYIAFRRINLELDRIVKISIVLLGWTFASILWAGNTKANINALLSLVLIYALYILMINMIRSRRDLKITIWAFISGNVLLAFILTYELWMRFFSRRPLTGLVANMLQGVNMSSRMMGIGLLLAIFLYQTITSRLAKIVLLILMTILGIGIVCSMSRSTWIGLLASFVVMGFIYLRHKALHLRISTFLAVGFIVIAALYTANSLISSKGKITDFIFRVQSSLSFSDAAGARFYIWDVAKDMFVTAPLVGHGFQSFPSTFGQYVQNSTQIANLGDEDRAGHNIFVTSAVELGVVGLLILFALLIIAAAKFWDKTHNSKLDVHSIAISYALFIYLIVACLVDDATDRKYFWVTLALITLIIRYGFNQEKSHQKGA